MKQIKDSVENLENSDSFKKWPHAPKRREDSRRSEDFIITDQEPRDLRRRFAKSKQKLFFCPLENSAGGEI
jgi:hypothetical protein